MIRWRWIRAFISPTGRILWRGTRAFFAFWRDYIFGDDWTVAAVIGAALLATWGLVQAHVAAWWLLPLAVLGAAVRSLHAAVMREPR
ncbi:MAG TPA: hypothetical protein VGI55_14945 [Solirubrobacteraceae bacterium]